MPPVPKAFVSYSWDNDAHKSWVRTLATRLRNEGVEVTLDQWHAVPGDQLPTFMETAVRESDFVLIVCTPNYRRKSDARDGGVGYEGDVITGEIFTVQNQRKFLPILCSGTWDAASPSWLKGKYYVDLRGTPYSECAYQDLLTTLHDARPTPPPVGLRPVFAPTMPTGSNPARPLVSVAGLAIILDEIVNLIHSVKYVGHTFGESRRILIAISRLHRLIEGGILRNRNAITDEVADRLRSFASVIDKFISEVNYTLPFPHEDKYTRDRERLKEWEYQVINDWTDLKSNLLDNSAIAMEFEEIKTTDLLVWNELGYDNRDRFWRFISPHAEEMLADADETELTLIEDIIKKDTFRDSDMLAQGYPREVFVEAINSLMRDKYVQTEDFHTFTLMPVGKRILSRLLTKKRKAR